jgi:hypothetical protein
VAMSEMSQAQVPPGGDADPDPSTEIVPPAARSPRDPSNPDEGLQPGRKGETGADVEDSAQESDESSRPAVVLPKDEDLPTTADEGLDEEGGSEAEAPSDPMPDIAGGETRPLP